MATPKYIDVNEFFSLLQSRGLVIVSANEFEASKELERKKLMRRKSLSLKEIADHKLLPVGNKKTVNNWIESGKIKPDETYREEKGQKRVMVLTSAIRRLGYAD